MTIIEYIRTILGYGIIVEVLIMTIATGYLVCKIGAYDSKHMSDEYIDSVIDLYRLRIYYRLHIAAGIALTAAISIPSKRA